MFVWSPVHGGKYTHSVAAKDARKAYPLEYSTVICSFTASWMASVIIFCNGVFFVQITLHGITLDRSQEVDQLQWASAAALYVSSSQIRAGSKILQSLFKDELESKMEAAALLLAVVVPVEYWRRLLCESDTTLIAVSKPWLEHPFYFV